MDLTPRQQLLQAQQDLINLVPDQVDVELRSEIEIRLSSTKPGGAHPNHTHIAVWLYLYADCVRYSVFTRQGRNNVKSRGVSVEYAEMLKQVMQHLHILRVYR